MISKITMMYFYKIMRTMPLPSRVQLKILYKTIACELQLNYILYNNNYIPFFANVQNFESF